MKYLFEIITLIAIILFTGAFLYTDTMVQASGEEGWGGTDGVGSGMVEATGYEPWIDNSDYTFTPPSGEIESCLFALQAVFGGLLIGWIFGSWATERRMKKNSI
ncbi:energy-coupling factor ABC transporter substrate-binding protein [Methanogenium sp. S4BF]|uniref:energy-coupling factor ABC transporter substrate-binding protein n=1 Tax=Methanogenium sp. S4BF TaxID=1789226 RepID=UPI002417F399|nr:energy-coupling factor ABC transporter substrate-binding protein [Methanogenium sp. S4BF]WFN35623.1 energy-coupling factor ABC transporter substrate-binding protein [Methanogenium sp. S4BF]